MGADGSIQISGYEILDKIGQGGMAVVYLARQETLARKVAIKVMDTNLEVLGDDLVARFRREAQVMASASHPNIVPVHDFGLVDGRPYLIMDYLSGGSLRQKLDKEGPLDPQVVLSLGQQIAGALGVLHPRGIVHRDIKPDNILFHDVGHAVLADFGIAKLFDAQTSLTRVGTTMGTYGYVSPEQAIGDPVDSRSDIYSLGVVLYEALTGELPTKSDSLVSFLYSLVHEPVNQLPVAYEQLQPLLDLALARETDERFASVNEFRAALVDCARQFDSNESGAEGDTVLLPRPEHPQAQSEHADDEPEQQATRVTSRELANPAFDKQDRNVPEVSAATPTGASEDGEVRYRPPVSVDLDPDPDAEADAGPDAADRSEPFVRTPLSIVSDDRRDKREANTGTRKLETPIPAPRNAAPLLRRPMVMVAISVAIAITAGVAWWFLNDQETSPPLAETLVERESNSELGADLEKWRVDTLNLIEQRDLSVAETRLREAEALFGTADLADVEAALVAAQRQVIQERIAVERAVEPPDFAALIQLYEDWHALPGDPATANAAYEAFADEITSLITAAHADGDTEQARTLFALASSMSVQSSDHDELRALLETYPVDPRVRELADGLMTTLTGEIDANGLTQALTQLVELRGLDTSGERYQEVRLQLSGEMDRHIEVKLRERAYADLAPLMAKQQALMQMPMLSPRIVERLSDHVYMLETEGERQFESGFLIVPETTNVKQTVANLLAIDPQNGRAYALRNLSAARLVAVAKEAYEFRMFEQAVSYLHHAVDMVDATANGEEVQGWLELAEDWRSEAEVAN